MNVRGFGLMLVLVSSAVAGCCQSSRYKVVAKDLLEVKAPGEVVARVIWDASLALARPASSQPGADDHPPYVAQKSRYYPYVVQTSRQEGSASDPDIFRNTTTFTDTSGRAVRIDAISRRGSTVLVFIERDNSDDPLPVLNQITRSLDKAGVSGPTRPAATTAAP